MEDSTFVYVDTSFYTLILASMILLSILLFCRHKISVQLVYFPAMKSRVIIDPLNNISMGIHSTRVGLNFDSVQKFLMKF